MITFVKIRGFLSFPMKHLWTEYIVPILWGMGIFLALVALWAGMKILVLGYFPVPTSSMRPSIVPGDVVFVNKLRLGPRTFRNLDFLDSDTIPVENIRLPGYGEIERNDVIVFNYPYADSWSKARFNYKAFYVKRCLGLPGDTLSIVNGFYKVAGCDLPLGNLRDQKRLSRTPLENLPLSISRADRPNGWTIKDFGPLYIPREGELRILQASDRVGNRRGNDGFAGEILPRRASGGSLCGEERLLFRGGGQSVRFARFALLGAVAARVHRRGRSVRPLLQGPE